MKIGEKGLDLIKHFEGLKLEAYKCPADVWTIGYGTTKGVKPGQRITESKAEELLKEDLKWVEGAINKNVRVDLNQNQFDALASWVYNLGETNLRSSTMLRKLNAGNYAEVPEQMKRWNKSNGQVLSGLVRRRQAEADLWQEPVKKKN